MDEVTDRQEKIRQYLLGLITDEADLLDFEERLANDESFGREFDVAEDDLIDDYIDGGLLPDDRARFRKYFLVSSERRDRLKLHAALREIARRPAPVPGKIGFPAFLQGWPAVRLVAATVLLCAAGFAVWRFGFYESPIDKAIADIRTAFRGQRPVESRTSIDPGYGPFVVVRSGDPAPAPADERARTRAFANLTNIADQKSAEAHRALGVLYLNDLKFEEALGELRVAERIAPESAELQSDLGAVRLEIAKKKRFEGNERAAAENLDASVGHSERALAIDPGFAPALFNRALALQERRAVGEAVRAWERYLAVDPASGWAEEARRHLEALRSRSAAELSAEELESRFLTAAAANDATEAWRLLNGNRELIRGKYLPQRLAASLLRRDDPERSPVADALKFAARLESERLKDPFASRIAEFHSNLTGAKIDRALAAHTAVEKGNELCLVRQAYGEAASQYERAAAGFRAAGSEADALLADYLAAYATINDERTEDGIVKLERIRATAKREGFVWLEMTVLHWIGGGNAKLGRSAKASAAFREATAMAERLGDSYALQRNLIEHSNLLSFLGQADDALRNLARLLEEGGRSGTSLRQQYRNNVSAYNVLMRLRLFRTARLFALESAAISDELNDQMFRVVSRVNAATAFARTGNHSEAERSLGEAAEVANSITDQKTGPKMRALTLLARGDLAHESGQFDEAANRFAEAVRLYESLEMPARLYEARKGSLRSAIALGKTSEAEAGIPPVLEMAEGFRDRIGRVDERTSFFDREQSVYEIAAGFEAARGRLEAAYDYAERANARSLIDWLAAGEKSPAAAAELRSMLDERAELADLAAIRSRMPADTQILQFTVLDDRILIWVVSRDKFVGRASSVPIGELERLVGEYLKAVRDPSASAGSDEIGSRLYRLLLSPVAGDLDPAKSVCLIPGKMLFFVPFAALRGESGKAFVEEFEHFYAPGANAFLRFTEMAAERAAAPERKILSVGNPKFDRTAFPSLADLQGAETEAEAVAALYPESRTFLGSRAVKADTQSALAGSDVFHFAGHYVVVPNSPLSSFLLLAENESDPEASRLTNRELAAKRLARTRLVVLSACQTGVEQYVNGEGLIGLSRTFLAAGVPLVVGSQWQVDSAASVELMRRFHENRRRGGMPSAKALRSAQIGMMTDPSGRFRAPFYWAGFAVFGGRADF